MKHFLLVQKDAVLLFGVINKMSDYKKSSCPKLTEILKSFDFPYSFHFRCSENFFSELNFVESTSATSM